MGFDVETRIRNVTAVLGPTNTGKTHLAIERMLGHETGMIGLPLRLLAREVYDRIVQRVGADKVALITGEEKIRPESPRFWVSTVEAMPREIDVDFLAIDEIQLAADPERGHVFTDRLLHARGKLETLLLGAGTMRDAISDLVPGANFITRPRLSKLTYTGQKKITRLPARTAVVAFSASDVYSIAELIRRQQGGAAVVMGALSPRTRNAQVALYQSGDVDYLVATDAIGMGLNLDVNHVSFASTRKFDGHNFRQLTPAELAQIAGRAGRHMNDGTFGVTGDVEPFEQDVIDRLESHTFDSVKVLQWRNRALDFSSVYSLRESLRQLPAEQRLVRARTADDVAALETVCDDREVTELIRGPASVALLWDVCQIPDYRKISSQNHAELVSTVYKFLRSGDERIPEDWLAKQVELADRTDGDIDTLATRIAHIRTWTFVSNRSSWLKDPADWQARTREVEDNLSDALHQQLTQRFVDRRTSALMKGMRAKEELNADIADDGAIHVESHYVGRLKGFRFIPDNQPADGIHGKAARNAAAQVLAKELGMRVRRVAAAKNDAFKLTRNGRVMWRDQEIARLEPSEDGIKPQINVIADEHLQAVDKEKVQERLNQWLTEIVAERLAPVVEISKAEDVAGLAKGIAFRLVESFGSLKRELVADEIKTLDQNARSQLRKYGVRFGAFNIYFPQVLKPSAAELTLALWTLKHGAAQGLDLEKLPDPPRPGLTSVPADPKVPEDFYRACGYHVCGPRAVRMDILERLADLIRPLIAWRRPADNPSATPPKGSTGDGAFVVIPEMLSILGCSSQELGLVLKTLGFRLERRPKRKPVATPVQTAQETTATDPSSAAEAALADIAVDPAAHDAALEAASEPAPEAAEATPSDTPAQPATAEAEAAADATAAPPSAETPAEAPSGEPSTSEATSEPARTDAVAAPAEPEMEEIWRPRRRRDEERRRDHRDNRDNRDHRGHRNRHRGGATAGQPAAGAQTEAASSPTDARPEHRRDQNRDRDRDRDRPRDGKPRHHEGGGNRHGGKPQGKGGEQHQHGRPHGGNQGRDQGRRGDRREDGGRPAQRYSTSQPKRQTVDPDSPFAKLSALKAALEKRTQESSS